MWVFKRRLPLDVFDLVQVKILEDALAFHFNDFALMMHEIVNRKIFFERIIDAVEAALAESGKIERRFAQSFAGNSAGVDATAARIRRAFNDGYALAEISSLRSSFFPRGATTDDDQVETVVGCQQNLPSE